MPHDRNLNLTLTGGLTAALIPGFITQKMRLSPLVGYLVAGMCVGPHFLGLWPTHPRPRHTPKSASSCLCSV